MHDPKLAIERYLSLVHEISGDCHQVDPKHESIRIPGDELRRILKLLLNLRGFLKHPLPSQRDTSLESLVPEDLLEEADAMIARIMGTID